jgi:siroheme synthase
MKGETRPTGDDLIAVVSGWENFLVLAKTMLVAVRIEPESLIIRSTKEENWRKGLNSSSMVICDSLTAKSLEKFQNVRIFNLYEDLKTLQDIKLVSPSLIIIGNVVALHEQFAWLQNSNSTADYFTWEFEKVKERA